MADTMRHRYGAKNVVKAEVATGTVIQVGDLCYLDTNKVINFATKVIASVADCSDNFLGVAMQASASGETDPIRIATSGVFEFDMTSGTVYLGYSAEPAQGGTYVEDQKIAPASTKTDPIGVCIPHSGDGKGGTSETRVLVHIQSAIMKNVLA